MAVAKNRGVSVDAALALAEKIWREIDELVTQQSEPKDHARVRAAMLALMKHSMPQQDAA